jgi:membrane-anchored mycosin MYCP
MSGGFRGAAALVTAVLLLGGPAAVPAFAAPAAPPAPSDTSTAPPGPDSWQPPPVQPALAPPDGPPGPGSDSFQLKDVCQITSAGNGQIPGAPPAQDMLDIKSAQQFSQGAGVTVAVIDTGVNPHPFLQGRLTGGGDYVDPNGHDGTTDCDGHGTLTAGIIAADTTGSGLGFTGVAPKADILAIRQTSQAYQDSAGRTAGTSDTLARAIVHAANTPGVRVITTSVDRCEPETQARTELGNATDGDPQLQAAVHYAVEQKDVVVVNSAGNIPAAADPSQQQGAAAQNPCQDVPQNDNPDPDDVKQVEVPAVYADDVLSVGSVDPRTGSVSNFSEWGPWVSVAAPGEDIISIDPGTSGGLTNVFGEPGSNSAPGPIQGTSFAAPYVAGIVALVRSKYPGLTARQVVQRIEATAQHPSGPGGRNNQVGAGIVDPVAALTAVIPGQNGVPADGNTTIAAEVPHADAKDWRPLRIALIAIAAATAALLVIAAATRPRRPRR